MENKMTILLNDKEFIKELAKDEEVQLKIKDAIIDGIAKRVANGAVKFNDYLLDTATNKLIKQLFDESWGSLSFKQQYKVLVDKAFDEKLKEYVENESKKMYEKCNRAIDKFISEFEETIREYNIDGVLKSEIQKRLNECIKNLSQPTKIQ